MTDIVERLRNPIMRTETDGHHALTTSVSRAVIDPEDAERVRLAAAAEIERLREALREIACFNDEGGNATLEARGSWGAFDEPGSVQIARAALGEPKKTSKKE